MKHYSYLYMLKWSSKQKLTQHNHKCNMTIVNDLNRMTPLCCVFTLLSLQWPRLIYTVIAKGNNILCCCWNTEKKYSFKACDSYRKGVYTESSQVAMLQNTLGAHTHSPPLHPLWLVSIWKDCTFLPGNDPFDSACVRRNSAMKNKSNDEPDQH